MNYYEIECSLELTEQIVVIIFIFCVNCVLLSEKKIVFTRIVKNNVKLFEIEENKKKLLFFEYFARLLEKYSDGIVFIISLFHI